MRFLAKSSLLVALAACAPVPPRASEPQVVAIDESEVEVAEVDDVLSPAPPAQPAAVVVDGRIAWTPFDETVLERHLEDGRPVFVSFWAEWCAICKSNEKMVVDTEPVHEALIASGVLPMLADYTDEDPAVESWIAKLGGIGIPLYVIFLPDGRRRILPETISTDMLVSALRGGR